ncbi:MAG: hypothetical protein KGV48_003245, partial [Alcaligenaceae bacterium]|nr:hypothetical protein [Alcaligenaceae bacterium]
MWELLDLETHTDEVSDRVERISQGVSEAKTLDDIRQVYQEESGDLHFKMSKYRRRTFVLELAALVAFGVLMLLSNGFFSLFMYDTSSIINIL